MSVGKRLWRAHHRDWRGLRLTGVQDRHEVRDVIPEPQRSCSLVAQDGAGATVHGRAVQRDPGVRHERPRHLQSQPRRSHHRS